LNQKQLAAIRWNPNLTHGPATAEWEKWERPRHFLENILKRQVEVSESQRQVMIEESLRRPSLYQRSAEIAPAHANAMLMRRMHDCHFREVRSVTNLLLKVKRYERWAKVLEED